MADTQKEAVVFEEAGGVTVAALQTGEITPKVSELLEARLQGARDSGRPPKLVLDLSRLDFLGSVGLSALVVILRRTKKAGGQLALAGLSGLCRDVMRVTGLERVFQICQDVPAAAEAVQKT